MSQLQQAAPDGASGAPPFGVLPAQPYPTWRLLVVAAYWFALSFFWGGFLSITLPALSDPLAQKLFGPESVNSVRGIMAGIGIIIAIVVQPLSGAFSDRSQSRFGRRRPYMTVGTAITIGALTLAGVAANWWLLLVAYLLLQFSDNLAQGAYQGLMPDVVPDGRRGAASAWLGVAQLSGTAFGSFFTGLIGAPTILAVNGALFVGALILTLLVVKERRFVVAEPVSAVGTVTGMFRGVARYPDFVWLMASRLFFLMGPASINFAVLNFLKTDIIAQSPDFAAQITQRMAQNGLTQADALQKVTETWVSYLLLAVIGGGLVLAYPASALSERVGRRPVIFGGAVVGLAGMLGLLAANAAHSFWLSALFGALIGGSWGVFIAVDWAYATDLIPISEAGRFMGLSNLATGGSQAVAAFIGGFIVDGFGYPALFVLGALYYAISIGFLTRVRETRGPRARRPPT